MTLLILAAVVLVDVTQGVTNPVSGTEYQVTNDCQNPGIECAAILANSGSSLTVTGKIGRFWLPIWTTAPFYFNNTVVRGDSDAFVFWTGGTLNRCDFLSHWDGPVNPQPGTGGVVYVTDSKITVASPISAIRPAHLRGFQTPDGCSLVLSDSTISVTYTEQFVWSATALYLAPGTTNRLVNSAVVCPPIPGRENYAVSGKAVLILENSTIEGAIDTVFPTTIIIASAVCWNVTTNPPTIQTNAVPVTTNVYMTIPGNVVSNQVECPPPPSGAWLALGDGAGIDYAMDVATDARGDVYTVGSFASATAKFGWLTLTNAGVSDGFVVRRAVEDGRVIWATRIGGIREDIVNAVAVNQTSGDVAVTGFITSDGDSTDRNWFIIVLDGNTGIQKWSRVINGQWGVEKSDIGYDIAIDPRNGDIVAVGQLAGWVDVGFGWVITTSSSTDSLVFKLSALGAPKWTKNFAANGVDYARSVAINSTGRIVVGGQTSGNINCGCGNIPLGGWSPDVYVAVLNETGGCLSSLGIGNDGYTGINSLAVDGNGNVALTGFFSQTLTVGTNSIQAIGTSAYVLKTDATLGSPWMRGLIGNVSTEGLGVSFDSAGNLFTSGWFRNTINPGTGLLTSAGGNDGYMVKYAANGAAQSGIRYGGAGDDRGYAVLPGVIVGATGGGSFGNITSNAVGSAEFTWKQ